MRSRNASLIGAINPYLWIWKEALPMAKIEGANIRVGARDKGRGTSQNNLEI